MSNESAVPRGDNRPHDRWVIQLLLRIQRTATRHTSRVIVKNPRRSFLDGSDHVTIHDLHVINIKQQTKSMVIHRFTKLKTPSGMVAHVIFVINARVEQLHHHSKI